MKIKENITKFGIRATRLITGLLAQEQGAHDDFDTTVTKGMPEILRKVAAEGAVLLENSILPFSSGEKISVFGRTQIDYFFVGYGSGGDVNAPYKINLLEALRKCPQLSVNESLAKQYEAFSAGNPIDHGEWGSWPRYYPEMPLDTSAVETAAAESNHAVLILGRAAGEDRDNVLEQGSYYLTDAELLLLEQVTTHFEKTVILLNVGSILDLSWLERFKGRIGALMFIWQGGMESGNAVADLLSGKMSPSGRLTDTIAKTYKDYPSAPNFGDKNSVTYSEDIYVGYRWFETFRKQDVLYPFGHGLSYTTFHTTVEKSFETDSSFCFDVSVKNTGEHFSGKETVCIYLEKPCAALGNPARVLAAFAKTETLAPGGSQIIQLSVSKDILSSYDSNGTAGHKSCYVTESGDYSFYIGGNVRLAEKFFSHTVESLIVVKQLSEACAPSEYFEIASAVKDGKTGEYSLKYVPVPQRRQNLKLRILDNLPVGTPITGDKGFLLKDVQSGKITMDKFIAQLSLTELEAITRGDYIMNSPLGAKGNAGVFGGVLESLRKKGIPPVTTTDGPSGIRLSASCSLLPIGTLLACSFNTELVHELYARLGEEMLEKKTDVLLAPGMNIHRNPLCGRNFEYFSEDPLLSGHIAAALVSGLQKSGVSACPKHFACNNQEYSRTRCDSRLSERALREIYLKGFEICIALSSPKNIMTSYNKINGVWGHYHYELCTSILRGEWKYSGSVMTDWWMRSSKSPEFPIISDNAYRVRAQVDLLMPGGKMMRKNVPDNSLLHSYEKPDGITLGEMQRSAVNILNFVTNSSAFTRK